MLDGRSGLLLERLHNHAIWPKSHLLSCLSSGLPVAPPNCLNVSPSDGGGGGSSSHRKRRTLIAPEMNLSLDQSDGSLLSDDFLDTPDDMDINVDDMDTPDETDSLEFITNGNDLEWEGQGSRMHMHASRLFTAINIVLFPYS